MVKLDLDRMNHNTFLISLWLNGIKKNNLILPIFSAREVIQQLQPQKPVWTQTTRNRLHRHGFHSWRPHFNCHLSANFCCAIKRWGQAQHRWRLREWRNCLFTDEALFVLYPSDYTKRVWHQHGEPRRSEVLLQHCETYGGGGRKFLGGLSCDGRIDLVKINGTLNATKYHDEILAHHVVQYRDALGNPGGPKCILVDDSYTPTPHYSISDPMHHQQNATLACQVPWYKLLRECLESSETDAESPHHSQ